MVSRKSFNFAFLLVAWYFSAGPCTSLHQIVQEGLSATVPRRWCHLPQHSNQVAYDVASDRGAQQCSLLLLTLRLRGAGRGPEGKKLYVPGGQLVVGGGVGGVGGGRLSKRNKVMELVQRKKEKAKRRKQRKMREEILTSKADRKQLGIISAILVSACLQDDDTTNDLLRMRDALRKYERDAEISEPKAFAELERVLWIPPRVRDVSGISESFAALPWDFEDTPENRARRAKYRAEHNISRGGHLFLEADPREKRVAAMLGEEDSDEISAPDYDRFTYIEPSIYACPEGDKKNPHRLPGVAKEVLQDIGWNTESQTNLDMDKPLTMDPLDEMCVLDRETLEEKLYHFRKRMTFRWCHKYPRYRAYIEREIERLEILIPHARPRDVPEEQWLEPREVWKLMEEGPEPFELPPDVAEEDFALFDRVREELEGRQREQERRGVETYKRLLAKGLVPPPPERARKLTEIEEEEAEREEAEREEKAAMREEELIRQEAGGDEALIEEVEELRQAGYNGSEAILARQWLDKAAASRIDGGALQIPVRFWNRWRDVTMTPLPDPDAHLETLGLQPSKFNSQRSISAKVIHRPPPLAPDQALPPSEAMQRIQDGELDPMFPALVDPEHVLALDAAIDAVDPDQLEPSARTELEQLKVAADRIRRKVVAASEEKEEIVLRARRQGEEEEEEEEEEGFGGAGGGGRGGGVEERAEGEADEEERKAMVRCLGRAWFLRSGPDSDAADRAPTTQHAVHPELRSQVRLTFEDTLDISLPPSPSAFDDENGTSDAMARVLEAGGERALDAMMDEQVMQLLEAALQDRLSLEAHLKWLRANATNDTGTEKKLRCLITIMLDIGIVPPWLAHYLHGSAPMEAWQMLLPASERGLLMSGQDKDSAKLLGPGGEEGGALLLEGKTGEEEGRSGKKKRRKEEAEKRKEGEKTMERLREVKALIKSLSSLKKGENDSVESKLASIRLKKLRAEAADLMLALAGSRGEGEDDSERGFDDNMDEDDTGRKDRRRIRTREAGDGDEKGAEEDGAKLASGVMKRGVRAEMHWADSDAEWRAVPEDPTEMLEDHGVADPAKTEAVVWFPEGAVKLLYGSCSGRARAAEDGVGMMEGEEDAEDADQEEQEQEQEQEQEAEEEEEKEGEEVEEEEEEDGTESGWRTIGMDLVQCGGPGDTLLDQVQNRTGCRVEVAQEPVMGRLVRGKGLSELETTPSSSSSTTAATRRTQDKSLPRGEKSAVGEQAGAVRLHAYRRIVLHGPPGARRAAKREIVREIAEVPKPADMSDAHFASMMKWREWYFGHRGPVQWHEEHNHPAQFIAALPDEALEELGIVREAPEASTALERMSAVLAELQTAMRMRGEEGDFEEAEQCMQHALAALFDHHPDHDALDHDDDSDNDNGDCSDDGDGSRHHGPKSSRTNLKAVARAPPTTSHRFAQYLRDKYQTFLPSRLQALDAFLTDDFELFP